ncbi:hypothetical protein LCGC14_1774790 [marine sediment metagenome]|uniref:Uncharacterized protein n=1 Tax=marine sediment metagenome TaxID=412755 RepID=A0A0F9JWW4_9ZZZZ
MERKTLRKIALEIREFNDATSTLVCNLDDQLVRYIGKNIDNLSIDQVKALLGFVRGIRTLKAMLVDFEKDI